MRLFKGTAEYTMMRGIQNLYLMESEMPRVKSYLKMRKARSEPESAVFNSECFAFFKLVHVHVVQAYSWILYYCSLV